MSKIITGKSGGVSGGRSAGARGKGSDVMMNEGARRMARWVVFAGLIVFTAVLLGVLLTCCGRDGTFHLDYSISRYMGREAWGAIIFGIGNLVLVGCIGKYVWEMREFYGKMWVVIMAIMTGCFIGLSFCPIGLFDEVYGNFGIVSTLHQIFARLMFIMMAVAAVVMGVKRKKQKWYLGICIAYALYAVGCAILSATTQMFWDFNFVFETAYIYLFYVILML